MTLIAEYQKARQAILDHVGLVEDWTVYPFDDQTDSIWSISDGKVKFADSQEQFDSDGDYYEDDLYTQRFYPKHVYEGSEFTLVFCNPHTDGMIWWRLFDNSKRVL